MEKLGAGSFVTTVPRRAKGGTVLSEGHKYPVSFNVLGCMFTWGAGTSCFLDFSQRELICVSLSGCFHVRMESLRLPFLPSVTSSLCFVHF